MERLKRSVPEDLRRRIYESTPDDLPITCSQLLDFLRSSPQFHKMIAELADPEMGLCRKNLEAALDFKNKGNDCFRSGDYVAALRFYSQALRFVPGFCEGSEADVVPILYVNRASSMHKLNLFEECKHDCDRAIHYSPRFAKAWYRRGKANASLNYFQNATRDFHAAMSMSCSISEKQHIQEELEAVLRLHAEGKRTTNSKTSEIIRNSVYHAHDDEQQCLIELECVSTKDKGRGMVSRVDIPPGTLLHQEEPLAAIVLKSCRETHCHYCFNELPADTVFCSLCATPVYCSDNCREHAGLEHGHECGGANWPVVLPSEEVVAGRVIAKLINKSDARDPHMPIETLDFAHNYGYAFPERKLESQIYSVVLLYCLQRHFGTKFSRSGANVSQLVILLSQIKINAMTIVRMKSPGHSGEIHSQKHDAHQSPYTTNIDQLKVGQAIYLTGSFFNHSCQPNMNAYFLSRKLYIRSTEFVPSGCPIEISYGPQIGQYDFMDRQMALKNEYSFECHCSLCSEINLSDIVMHSFCCSKPNCFGAVPNNLVVDTLKNNFCQSSDAHSACHSAIPHRFSEKWHEIKEVASLLVEHVGDSWIVPGRCLCCGASHDLDLLNQQAVDAMTALTKLQQICISGNISAASILSALNSLNQLRSVRHAYSKDLACAEDIVAESYCQIENFESALEHCRMSLKILRKLYHKNHIVVGNELVKLASIELRLGEFSSAGDSIQQFDAIFSLHYGPHAAQIFPYLEGLRKHSFQDLHYDSLYRLGVSTLHLLKKDQFRHIL